MRIAIVDDIETERALLKMRLERQLLVRCRDGDLRI